MDRSYSLSAHPRERGLSTSRSARPQGARITVGARERQTGTVLEMLGPVGAFHLPDADRRARYLLRPPGSITPIMSWCGPSFPAGQAMSWDYHGAVAGGYAFHQELAYLPQWIRASRSSGPWGPQHAEGWDGSPEG